MWEEGIRQSLAIAPRHVKGAATLSRALGQMRSESSLGATSLTALEGFDSYSQ